MKKIWLILFLMIMYFLTACGEEEKVTNVSNLEVQTYSSKNKVSSKNNPRIVDSFYDENDNWYYTIEVGSISRMPLQSMNGTSMIRWTQNSTSYEKTVTSSYTDSSSIKEIVENQVTDSISSDVQDKLAIGLNATFEKTLSKFFLAGGKLNAALSVTDETLWKNSSSYENKYKTSYEQVSAVTKNETISEKIKFDESCPTGYYGWNLCGNVKVYAFVIYNPLLQIVNVVYTADIVASYWCFDYLTDEEFDNITLGFDYSSYLDYELPELVEPTKFIDIETITENLNKNHVTVSFDANGGYCNKTVIVAEGGNYGSLPKPTYNNQKYFAGWYDQFGNKITNETICVIGENHTLTAKWGDTTYSTIIDDFTLKEGVNIVTKTFDFIIDRNELIEAGYTQYKINVEFNIKMNKHNSDTDNVLFNLYASNIGLFSYKMTPTSTGKKHSITSSKIPNSDQPFLTENLNAVNNTITLNWVNANFAADQLLLDMSANISGLKITVTFYNPNES